MRIKKDYKLEKIVSKDKTRGILHNILIEHEDGKPDECGVAVATDGRMMVKVPVLLEQGESGRMVHHGALVEGRKKMPKRHDDAYIGVNNENVTLIDGAVLPTPNHESQYPAWKQVWPDESTPKKFTIALNPHMLAAMAEAMGDSEIVKLQFVDDCSPIIVTGKDTECKGILMPARTV